MAKGGKMKAVYNKGGKVGDPEKKKEAMKLIALNEADYDNNLGDFYREGNMQKADSVRKVMMDRFKRIVELGYGKLAEDSLPYNSLTSMNAYTELVQKQREQERGKKAPMGPFPRGVDTDGVKEKKMRPMFKKGGMIDEPPKEVRSISRQKAQKMLNDALIKEGFPSGMNDSNAPKYKLTQDKKTGEYIYRKQ